MCTYDEPPPPPPHHLHPHPNPAGALADGSGGRATGVAQIMARVVKPRLPPSGKSPASVSVKLASAKFESSQIVFSFHVDATDALGKRQLLSRTFHGAATFAPCGTRVESLWIDNANALKISKVCTQAGDRVCWL